MLGGMQPFPCLLHVAAEQRRIRLGFNRDEHVTKVEGNRTILAFGSLDGFGDGGRYSSTGQYIENTIAFSHEVVRCSAHAPSCLRSVEPS
jgi:hypothetical protein